MKKIFIFIWTVSIGHSLFCQVTSEPALPSAEDQIKIIYDATLGTSGLAGESKVYMHSGIIIDSPSGTSWQNVVGNWGQDDGIGEMTKVEGETDKWEITITPRSYFNFSEGSIYRIGMVFRNANGSKEGKSNANGDIFLDLLQTDFGISLLKPESKAIIVDTNETIDIQVAASEDSDFVLEINSAVIDNQLSTSLYSYTHTVTESNGSIPVVITATSGMNSATVSFSYVVRESTPQVSLPAGIKKGINYHSDPTQVTLCLEAPLKSSVYVLGDFNNWEVNSDFLMNQDGDLFWLEISGLEANVEYGFQYLVDESIYVADPYADKILDPEDDKIPTSIYPNLKPYPAEAQRDVWYHQRVSVLETDQTAFEWDIDQFSKPAKDELVIYELLIRDFFGVGQRSYKNLIDTLNYLENLGVNAIELMPITEFNSNESWGYNPTFMFAPDKYYGTKNDLKTLIDEAHKRGIAVILDMVMNHQDIPGTNAVMYFDGGITAENPWFNVSPTHPFNVFFDFNHESLKTQQYLDSVNLYWLEEYKFDGFRFDLSKGFTQNNTGSDVGLWSAYDQSRIDLLTRMVDVIWNHTPDAYIILEHFGDNSEEKVLSDYGMMLWSGTSHPYAQLAMGYQSSSNIAGVAASERGWNDNHLIGFMESHDEERMMYQCVQFGNENSSYSVKDYNTALERVMAASSFFYPVPGPKMLWQFGETGFDYSINRCTDGSINQDCRLSIKPTTWSYLENEENQRLFEVVKLLINLKTTYELFQSGEVSFFNNSTLSRYIWITQNDLTNPADPTEMNATIVGNFDITSKNLDVTFPHDGKWYHYFDQGDSIEVNGAITLTLQPGEFRVYTDVKLQPTTLELISNLKPTAPANLSANDSEIGITLSWEDKSRINSGYNIYRKTTTSDWELIDTISDTESYVDNRLVPNEEYEYQVAAYNAVGERISNQVSIRAAEFVLGVDNNTILLYPNPAEKILRLSAIDTPRQFQISSIDGRVLIKSSIQKDGIDVSKLSPGLYFLAIDGVNQTIKFVKK